MKDSTVDWRETGLKADAHRVRNLYRRVFDNPAKRLARERAIQALKAAGVSVVVTLWGGGICADDLVAAGFRVIAVDNGSMDLREGDRLVTKDRKRRALMVAAEEGGYEWRWGDVADHLAEGDGAFLDFHGPWSRAVRASVQASRHMTAVVVTLMPDHDFLTDATSALERQMAYQVFLKMSWAERPNWVSITTNGHVRRLIDYHGDHGQRVTVFLLARRHIQIGPPMSRADRAKMRRDIAEKERSRKRGYYRRMPDEQRLRYFARMRHQENHIRAGKPSFGCEWCGRTATRRICTVCKTEFVVHRTNQRRCSDQCAMTARLEYQRERRERNRPERIARERQCVVCNSAFVQTGMDSHTKTCGPVCRQSESRRRSREWAARYRAMRLAAVSGTAAEAVEKAA